MEIRYLFYQNMNGEQLSSFNVRDIALESLRYEIRCRFEAVELAP